MSAVRVRWHRALVCGGPAIVALVLSLAAALTAEPTLPVFEDVVKNLTNVNASLKSFQAEQMVELRILFFRYRLFATVYATRPARYRVVVRDPPWFLRRFGSVFAQAGSPEDVLRHYAPRRVEWREEAGRRLLYLNVERRFREVNPPSVEAFVDPDRWLVEKMVLHYEWGDVLADYRYEVVADYLLPSVITIRLPRYLAEAVVFHRDYQLNVPLPDSLFESR